MRRRSFLVHFAGGVVATPILLSIAGCGGDDGGGGGGGGGGETVNGFVVENSDGTHPHQFTLRCDDEGAAEATYTATGSGHTHSVALTQQDLIDIFEGREVTKETSDVHAHTWTIQMPTAGCMAVPDDDDDPPDEGGW